MPGLRSVKTCTECKQAKVNIYLVPSKVVDKGKKKKGLNIDYSFAVIQRKSSQIRVHDARLVNCCALSIPRFREHRRESEALFLNILCDFAFRFTDGLTC